MNYVCIKVQLKEKVLESEELKQICFLAYNIIKKNRHKMTARHPK
jgi:hypothetical protein